MECRGQSEKPKRYQNKRVVYDLLLKTSAQATLKIAATQRHLGAKIGITSVLHTWGSAMMHHPHVHMIVPGGGLSPARGEEGDSPTGNKNGSKWVSCRPNFFVHVKLLSRLFRRLFREKLLALHKQARLEFFGDLEGLSEHSNFAKFLAPLKKAEWVVYAKPPFAGLKAVLAYMSRYTHRVAISNSRLVKVELEPAPAKAWGKVSFKYKDYRAGKDDKEGNFRKKVMTLDVHEFIRRFLLHVLPRSFHRIRYYGFLVNGGRAKNLAKARELLGAPEPEPGDEETDGNDPDTAPYPCPHCGDRMNIIATFEPDGLPRAPPDSPARRACS